MGEGIILFKKLCDLNNKKLKKILLTSKRTCELKNILGVRVMASFNNGNINSIWERIFCDLSAEINKNNKLYCFFLLKILKLRNSIKKKKIDAWTEF